MRSNFAIARLVSPRIILGLLLVVGAGAAEQSELNHAGLVAAAMGVPHLAARAAKVQVLVAPIVELGEVLHRHTLPALDQKTVEFQLQEWLHYNVPWGTTSPADPALDGTVLSSLRRMATAAPQIGASIKADPAAWNAHYMAVAEIFGSIAADKRRVLVEWKRVFSEAVYRGCPCCASGQGASAAGQLRLDISREWVEPGFIGKIFPLWMNTFAPANPPHHDYRLYAGLLADRVEHRSINISSTYHMRNAFSTAFSYIESKGRTGEFSLAPLPQPALEGIVSNAVEKLNVQLSGLSPDRVCAETPALLLEWMMRSIDAVQNARLEAGK